MNRDQGTPTSTDSDISEFPATSTSALAEQVSPVCGEKALWLAVIAQALFDARMKTRSNEERSVRWKALYWLSGSHPDFHTVCDYAGLHPAYVRAKVAVTISNERISKNPLPLGEGRVREEAES